MTTRISDVSTEELLRDIHSPESVPVNDIVLWLDTEGYYPGTTPIKASELYQRYREWRSTRVDIIGEVRNFGEVGSVLTARFPKKRRKTGFYYLISRKEEPNIPAEITGGNYEGK